MEIREEEGREFQGVWDVESRAFPTDAEARLVEDLMGDPTARPILSLLAFEDGKAVGHVLLTKAALEGKGIGPDCMILAPLAVVPERQGHGIGSALMCEALDLAGQRGTGLVFVLGHPGYYPRAGFRNDAKSLGFEAPYPIAAKDRDAWMVVELKPRLIGSVQGRVRCADALMKPELWKE